MPSCIDASGAMRALLPYWLALATATTNARCRVIDSIHRHLVLLGCIPRESAQADAHVRDQAARAGAREGVRDPGVEADAHHVDERRAVDRGGVDDLDAQSAARADRFAKIHRQSEVAREAVAGAGGDDAEGDVGSDEPLRDFVNGAVAADGEDALSRRATQPRR